VHGPPLLREGWRRGPAEVAKDPLDTCRVLVVQGHRRQHALAIRAPRRVLRTLDHEAFGTTERQSELRQGVHPLAIDGVGLLAVCVCPGSRGQPLHKHARTEQQSGALDEHGLAGCGENVAATEARPRQRHVRPLRSTLLPKRQAEDAAKSAGAAAAIVTLIGATGAAAAAALRTRTRVCTRWHEVAAERLATIRSRRGVITVDAADLRLQLGADVAAPEGNTVGMARGFAHRVDALGARRCRCLLARAAAPEGAHCAVHGPPLLREGWRRGPAEVAKDPLDTCRVLVVQGHRRQHALAIRAPRRVLRTLDHEAFGTTERQSELRQGVHPLAIDGVGLLAVCVCPGSRGQPLHKHARTEQQSGALDEQNLPGCVDEVVSAKARPCQKHLRSCLSAQLPKREPLCTARVRGITQPSHSLVLCQGICTLAGRRCCNCGGCRSDKQGCDPNHGHGRPWHARR